MSWVPSPSFGNLQKPNRDSRSFSFVFSGKAVPKLQFLEQQPGIYREKRIFGRFSKRLF
jgi:hypothetical protein